MGNKHFQWGYLASIGDTVVDIRNSGRIALGTVTNVKCGMYRNTMVEVFWHHLGYTNWETPGNMHVVFTGDRDVAVSSSPLD